MIFAFSNISATGLHQWEIKMLCFLSEIKKCYYFFISHWWRPVTDIFENGKQYNFVLVYIIKGKKVMSINKYLFLPALNYWNSCLRITISLNIILLFKPPSSLSLSPSLPLPPPLSPSLPLSLSLPALGRAVGQLALRAGCLAGPSAADRLLAASLQWSTLRQRLSGRTHRGADGSASGHRLRSAGRPAAACRFLPTGLVNRKIVSASNTDQWKTQRVAPHLLHNNASSFKRPFYWFSQINATDWKYKYSTFLRIGEFEIIARLCLFVSCLFICWSLQVVPPSSTSSSDLHPNRALSRWPLPPVAASFSRTLVCWRVSCTAASLSCMPACWRISCTTASLVCTPVCWRVSCTHYWAPRTWSASDRRRSCLCWRRSSPAAGRLLHGSSHHLSWLSPAR